jgi:hypothetical protein
MSTRFPQQRRPVLPTLATVAVKSIGSRRRVAMPEGE